MDTTTKTAAASELQPALVALIDAALQCKQAHWNIVGPRFRSVHLELDEIVETVRTASDEVAERIVALDVAADGRADSVAQSSPLEGFPAGRPSDQETVALIAARINTLCNVLRTAQAKLADIDPVSEDLVIGITATLEKHLWMLRSQFMN